MANKMKNKQGAANDTKSRSGTIPSTSIAVYDMVDACIASLQLVDQKDPIDSLVEGLVYYFRIDPFGSEIRLRNLLQVFVDTSKTSNHLEHQSLLEIAKQSLTDKDPLAVVLKGIVELVSINLSLTVDGSGKAEFYKKALENFGAFEQQLVGRTLPTPRWIVDAVVMIRSLHCMFWMYATTAVYKDVKEKDGVLRFVKDERQTAPRQFIWSDSPFENVEKKEMEAVFSSDMCEEALSHLAPLIIFILKGNSQHSTMRQSCS